MKRFVEFVTADHDCIVVEVEESDASGMVRAARSDEIVAKASLSFEEALEKVKPAASTIIQKLRSLRDQPDEITVLFGLKLSADVGAVVASAGVEANYAVTLRWKKPEEPKKAGG